MTEFQRIVYSRDFWVVENAKYSRPHLRMRKVARLVKRLAAGRDVTLLDVGCGPATLNTLLDQNIRYYGIDIAVQEPAPNLKQSDILQEPISSDAAPFDLIVAEGLFEYLADQQSVKFAEIADLLAPSGKFVVTYVNFDHRQPSYYWPYSNIQPSEAFRAVLAEHFVAERKIPTAYNWNHSEPGRWYVREPNAHLNVSFPFLTKWLGVEFIYVCRLRSGRN